MSLLSAHVNYKKGPNESELQYIWRMCSAKDSGLIDITWSELADILNKELIEDESEYFGESAYRKKYQQAKAFYDEVFSKMASTEYHDQIIEQRRELQKERYKFFDQRIAYNKLLRQRSRQEEINELIEKVVSSGSLPQLKYQAPIHTISAQDMLISLSDIHYGADISNSWNTYNPDICVERFKKYLDRIIKIQRAHGAENAIVWCNGDEISGNIHQEITVTNKENVIQQIMGVSEIITGFLAELSRHFKTIRFVSVAGNHSRLDKKDNALKDERLDDLVEWYLKARLSNFANIIFDSADKVDETMYLINVRGLNYAGCHGDYDIGKTKVLDLQIMLKKPIYAVLYGHMHTNKIDTYQGIKIIMSGSFQGMDNYCVTKRIYGRPEQMVCLVDDHGLVCSYDIDLSLE